MSQRQQVVASDSPAYSGSVSDAEQLADIGSYMTCHWSSNQLGVAYLDQATGHVSLRWLCKLSRLR